MLRVKFLKAVNLGAAALIAAGAAAFGQASDANAGFALRLDDGVNPAITVSDNGVGDIVPLSGAITFAGSLGGWLINVTTGLSGPVLSAPFPHLDLNSVNVTSPSGGNLTIMLTDTDFTFSDPVAAFVTSLGGTTNGNLSFQVYVNNDNTEFSTAGTKVADFGPFGSGAFSASAGGFAPISGPYSVTLVATFAHSRAGQVTSFDGEFQIPEPEALAMFGIGLLGMGGLIARRRRTAAN